MPDEAKSDGEEQEDINLEQMEEESKNYITRLYEDEKFIKEKELIQEQIIKAEQTTQESKSFINEMDDFLKDLQSWK